ncbi:hypothetical protein [Variovorax sp. J31P207]|uniref:hypothetical protein n=1 Tax=Variovorax sp. J31P207 TaxID=3053510 RepID=UPI002576E2EA|nr:hypothetical protein [Variovorax sp. J31P207]MDM0072012.1 hypothetical protein [Variovorax sp. J31P207]
MSHYQRDSARVEWMLQEAARLIEARAKIERPSSPITFADEDEGNKPLSETDQFVRELSRRLKRRDETGAGSGDGVD